MPSIDYSKTKIYKFQCKTDAEKPAFFGHCTHIPNMKYRLNNDIINGKDTVISNTIRENGSLDNWDLTIIEVFDTCLNKKQADDRVAYFREEYLVNKRLEKSANWLEKSAVFCDDTEPSEKTIDNSKKTCTFCSKVFSKRSNMLVHQKTSCKLKNIYFLLEEYIFYRISSNTMYNIPNPPPKNSSTHLFILAGLTLLLNILRKI